MRPRPHVGGRPRYCFRCRARRVPGPTPAYRNLYAFLFAIKKPFVHVMAYFVSVLRQRISNFEAKPDPSAAAVTASVPGGEMIGVSINDLRKNLRDLNEYVDNECRSAPARYGVLFDASLITAIDPPPEVESLMLHISEECFSGSSI